MTNGSDQKTHQREKNRFVWMPVIVLIMGTISVMLFFWSHSIREQQVSRDFPHDDAVMEISNRISTHHLWLEEHLSGDASVDMYQTKTHLDRAMKLAGALLEGGMQDEHSFYIKPLQTPSTREQAEKLRADLIRYSDLSEQRLGKMATMGVGTEADQQLDALYREISGITEVMAGQLKKEISSNQSRSRFLVRTILVFLVMIITVTVIGLWLRERQLRSAEMELKGWNEQLEHQIKERTRELEETRDQLIRKEKLAAVGELAGSIGHELRNPLGIIGNSAYYLKTKFKNGDEKVMKHLGILEKEVQRSNRIISDLLDYARMSPPSLSKVNVNSIFQNILAGTKVPANIRIQARLDENLPEIPADPDQIRQVFQNLITNAVQAMPEGGSLEIETGAKDDFVQAMFKDTGEGISTENLRKVFEPLVTTKIRGIGLGLPIVKGIIDRHRGSIEVASEIGRGTTFTVKLDTKRNEGERVHG